MSRVEQIDKLSSEIYKAMKGEPIPNYYLATYLYDADYRKQSEVIDEFTKWLLDAFPEGNRDARCPAIYYDDYREIIEEIAEKMKGSE